MKELIITIVICFSLVLGYVYASNQLVDDLLTQKIKIEKTYLK